MPTKAYIFGCFDSFEELQQVIKIVELILKYNQSTYPEMTLWAVLFKNEQQKSLVGHDQ